MRLILAAAVLALLSGCASRPESATDFNYGHKIIIHQQEQRR